MQPIIHKMHDPQGQEKNLLIASQRFAEDLLREHTPESPTIVISITTPGDPDAAITARGGVRIFRLSICDADKDDPAAGVKAAVPEDFADLKTFLDANRNARNLIVHCGAGISRSPAVAEAVCEYLGWTSQTGQPLDDLIRQFYVPNRHVLRTCTEVLKKGD